MMLKKVPRACPSFDRFGPRAAQGVKGASQVLWQVLVLETGGRRSEASSHLYAKRPSLSSADKPTVDTNHVLSDS